MLQRGRSRNAIGREDVRPEGETSVEMRQVLAGPTPPSGGPFWTDPTFWGPVTHNGGGPEGPVTHNGRPAGGGGRIRPSTPCELARSRPAEPRSHRPIRRTPAVFFPRNDESDAVSDENHAAGPGHGKVVISSYMVANNETWTRG